MLNLTRPRQFVSHDQPPRTIQADSTTGRLVRWGWALALIALFVSGCVSPGRTSGIYTPGYRIGGLPTTGH